LQWIKNW